MAGDAPEAFHEACDIEPVVGVGHHLLRLTRIAVRANPETLFSRGNLAGTGRGTKGFGYPPRPRERESSTDYDAAPR
jgi:hypothetical protein